MRAACPPLGEFLYRPLSLASNTGPITSHSYDTVFTFTFHIVCEPPLLRYVATARKRLLTVTASLLPPLTALSTLTFGVGFLPLRLAKPTSGQEPLTLAARLCRTKTLLTIPTFPLLAASPTSVLPLSFSKAIRRLRNATITAYTTLDAIATHSCVDSVRMLMFIRKGSRRQEEATVRTLEWGPRTHLRLNASLAKRSLILFTPLLRLDFSLYCTKLHPTHRLRGMYSSSITRQSI